MVEVSENKIDLVLGKLNSLERKFDDFEERYNDIDFKLKTMIELDEYESNPENFIRKSKEEFLKELEEW